MKTRSALESRGESEDAVVQSEKKGDGALVEDSGDEDPERIREESDAPPPMPSCVNLEPSEAEIESCNVAKEAATQALNAGDVTGALDRITEAVLSGGANALLFARRAELLLRLKRPKAAILDCSAALEVNPDCGKAFRIRGVAHRRLGNWAQAHSDLAQGQKLDFDDGTTKIQAFVSKKAQVLADR